MKKLSKDTTEESIKALRKAIRQKNKARAELTEAERDLAEAVKTICDLDALVEKRKSYLERCWKEVHTAEIPMWGATTPE